MASQTFEPQDLESSIDFDDIPKNMVKMVEGKGKMIYWKGCNVTVYENDSQGKKQIRKLVDWPNGEGQVPFGTKLYITDGKIMER